MLVGYYPSCLLANNFLMGMDLSPGMWKGRNPALHTSEQKMQPRNEPQFNSLSIKRYKPPDNFLSELIHSLYSLEIPMGSKYILLRPL